MRTILINATAARTSGALTVLRDFISYLKLKQLSDMKFYIFTTVDEFEEDANLKVLNFSPMTWKQRIVWDKNGFRNFCEQNYIYPDLIISMQNTCVNYPSVSQLVYYHQPLPLIKYPWNPLKKEERILFLYAHFYKYFVNKYNENAEYVVQLPYIKEMFVKKFKNISSERVSVIRPNLPNIDTSKYSVEPHIKRFIYPATALAYKNHICIINAVKLLIEKKLNLVKFEIIFTISEQSKVFELIKKYNLHEFIKCIGNVPYDNLMELYKNSDVLLFPSKIETYGMPLIEASLFGLLIVASDLPYAREVLEKYENKVFLSPNNPALWKEELANLLQSEVINKGDTKLISSNKSSWDYFIDIVNKMTSNK